MRAWLFVLLLPLAASAADDTRISFLEQEVRNLQRDVQSLSQRVNDMQHRPARITTSPLITDPGATSPGPDSWVDAGKWKSLRTGMSELQVIAILGAPTSMREENGARVLLYAMEIGSSGFLGGSVWFRDRVVEQVKVPTLQ